MKWLIRAVLALFPGFMAVAAFGAGELQPYRVDSWQVDDGLPQSSVTAIVQTHDGYLWLGTFGGLVRFDGVRFKVFTPNNAPGLASIRILALYEDRAGALWIATEEGQLIRYAGGQFELCSPPGWVTFSEHLEYFAEGADGHIWLITPRGELIRFSAANGSVAHRGWESVQPNVNFLTADRAGGIWISTDRTVGVWREGRFRQVLDDIHSDRSQPAVLGGGRSGGCWVAANGRLRRVSDQAGVIDFGPYPWPKGGVVRMMEDHRGQLWVGTYGSGVYCYGPNGLAQRFSSADGLPGDLVRSLCEDREGNVWVGTEGYGLARIRPVAFRSFSRKQGLAGDCVLSVCQGPVGELWVGMIGDGVDCIRGETIRHYGVGQGLPNDFIWSVFCDRKKTIWAGTWGGGLCRLVGDQFVAVPMPSECRGVICALFEDGAGALWLGQQCSAPEVFALKDGSFSATELRGHFAGADVRAFAQDPSGALWIGTAGDGLYRMNQGRQTRFGRLEGLSCESIRSLYADAAGTVWIGTDGGGLNAYAGGKFTAFTSRDGLPSDTLGFVAEDAASNLWCGSLGGVFRVNKNDLSRFVRQQIPSIPCVAYNASDGLPSSECTGRCQPCGCRTPDGRLWFPTVRGLAVVDPANVPANPLPPPVAIEEVVADGRARTSIEMAPPGRTEVRLPAGTERLEFHYTGLSLTEPMNVRFKYRLEGLEENWIEAGGRRIANYSHLQPGHYFFRVKACNNDGVWNENGDALGLLILPRFWQTWWFRPLCIAVAIAIFVTAYEARLLAERRLVRMRLRIASDLHDEVGSNLGSIALLSEMAGRQEGPAAEELGEIRRVALQTVGALRDIVWFLDPAADNMEDLVLRMKETARTMLPGVLFAFHAKGQAGARALSLRLRQNVFPMFKEILHNIAKHARASKVEISVSVDGRQFNLRVVDNGVGFDEARARRGNGLKNLRRRTGDLHGTLTIESRPGNGTTVTLTAPIP
ncbi:MAG: two-component regulator propeller domain-containing protein [Verrucomicrobiota bacterium]